MLLRDLEEFFKREVLMESITGEDEQIIRKQGDALTKREVFRLIERAQGIGADGVDAAKWDFHGCGEES